MHRVSYISLLSDVRLHPLSAVSLLQVYATEAGFDGADFLPYMFLSVAELPNTGPSDLPRPLPAAGQAVFGGAFRPEAETGTMFVIRVQLPAPQVQVYVEGIHCVSVGWPLALS